MAALAAAGDRPAALTEYRRLADRLRRELRLAPSEETWRLAEQIRAVVPTAPAVRSRPGVVPLFGRDEEFRALRAAWAAARTGHGGLAMLHGAPGIGKTRLVAQLVDLAEQEGAVVATGAAPELAGPPLAPWVEIGADLVRALTPLPDEPWVGALAPLLPAHVVAGPDGAPPDLAQGRLFEAVVALLETSARRAPTLVVLEDLQAADDAGLALLAYVARRAPGSRLLVVGTRRDRPARDQILTLEQAARQRGTLRADVRVDRLAPEAVGELARAVGATDEDAVIRVVAAAEGNPLLAVESARALAAGNELPLGLRGAARAAMARLGPDARELVRTLAVAGRDVALEEAADRAGVSVVDALPPAEDAGLLESAGDRIRFGHALLRDAVYADLSASERTARHLRAAEQLAGLTGRAAEAGAHLRAAGKLTDAGALLLAAAAQARTVGALADATLLLREACGALPDDPGPALALADVLAWRGRPADAGAAFEQAVQLLERSGDAVALATAHLRFAEWHYGPICRPAVAVEACRRALAVMDGAGLDVPELRGQILAVYAWCASIGGELTEVDRALAMLSEVAGGEPADPVLACGAHRARCFALLRQGRFAEAVEPGLRAAEAAERAHRPDLIYTGLVNAAFGAAVAGELVEALRLLDRALVAVRGQGMLAIETLLLIDRSWLLVRVGKHAEARAAGVFARRAAEHLDAPDLQALVDAERGRVELRAGDHALAADLLAAALAAPDATISRPLARLQRAEALARLNRVAEAEAELAAVVMEPVRTGDWPDTLVARLTAVEGLVALARGDTETARRRFEDAAAGWRQRMSPAELGRQLGAVMVDLGRPIIGMVVPSEELAVVERDRAALAVRTEA
jgi:tetratricopeptide (TPR) repeat protein